MTTATEAPVGANSARTAGTPDHSGGLGGTAHRAGRRAQRNGRWSVGIFRSPGCRRHCRGHPRHPAHRPSQPGRPRAVGRGLASFYRHPAGHLRGVGSVACSSSQRQTRPDHHRTAPAAPGSDPRPAEDRRDDDRGGLPAGAASGPTWPPAAASSRQAKSSTPGNSPSGWSPTATSGSTRSSIPASSAAAAASATSSRPDAPDPRPPRILRRRDRIDPHLRRRQPAEPGEASGSDAAGCPKLLRRGGARESA